MIKRISPAEAKSILNQQANTRLIDVREEWEFNTAKIDNSELMPLSEFNIHFPKLNPDDNLIIVCHHGHRSFRVCTYLEQNGFKNISNLDGGIDAWSREIDPAIPTY